MRLVAAETYDVLWKVPARGDDQRFALYLLQPEDVENVTPPSAAVGGGAWIERSRIIRVGDVAAPQA